MKQKETVIQHLKERGVIISFPLLRTPRITYPNQSEDLKFLIYSLGGIKKIRKSDWQAPQTLEQPRSGVRKTSYPNLK